MAPRNKHARRRPTHRKTLLRGEPLEHRRLLTTTVVELAADPDNSTLATARPIPLGFDFTAGETYEYRVLRDPPASPRLGEGFVYVGLDLALDNPDSTIQSPGTVVLVVDETRFGAPGGSNLGGVTSDCLTHRCRTDTLNKVDRAPPLELAL